MADGEMELVESFDIDDDQLDGLSPQECFVLGYELCQICRRAENDLDEFKMLIHADNRDRVVKALVKRNRPHIVTWMRDDLSEGWLEITVLRRVV